MLANDSADIDSAAGAIAFSLNGPYAINASIAVVDVKNSVVAAIDGATVTSNDGDVDVIATETARMVNRAVGGSASGGGSLALGGSIAVSTINNTVSARIANVGSRTADVTADGSLTVQAKDTPAIVALAGNVGALIGWGIPEERGKVYDRGIREGGILMAVRPRSDEDAAFLEDSWRAHRGEHVYR